MFVSNDCPSIQNATPWRCFRDARSIAKPEWNATTLRNFWITLTFRTGSVMIVNVCCWIWEGCTRVVDDVVVVPIVPKMAIDWQNCYFSMVSALASNTRELSQLQVLRPISMPRCCARLYRQMIRCSKWPADEKARRKRSERIKRSSTMKTKKVPKIWSRKYETNYQADIFGRQPKSNRPVAACIVNMSSSIICTTSNNNNNKKWWFLHPKFGQLYDFVMFNH